MFYYFIIIIIIIIIIAIFTMVPCIDIGKNNKNYSFITQTMHSQV